MKKHNPIKRSQELVQLSREHHFGLLLVWEIRRDLGKGVEFDKISKRIIDFYTTDLEKHFKEEEETVFTLLPPDHPLRVQAEDEHRKIYAMIEMLKNTKADAALLNEFADTLEAHIRFEERTLFNLIQEMQGTAQP
jgi:hemerythrin-like domain-containing protein